MLYLGAFRRGVPCSDTKRQSNVKQSTKPKANTASPKEFKKREPALSPNIAAQCEKSANSKRSAFCHQENQKQILFCSRGFLRQSGGGQNLNIKEQLKNASAPSGAGW
jgi:hypothetical protein